jgi:hypothetical protein
MERAPGGADSETESDAIPVVVVVDRAETRRHRVAEAIRHAGGRSVELSTPLEAIALVETGADVAAIAVAEDLTQTRGDELVEYLSATHPELEVAVIPRRPPTADDHPAHAAVVLPCDGRDATGPVRELVERAAEHHHHPRR